MALQFYYIKTTEVLYQPNYTRNREADIMVDGNKLNSVLEFTYPGSTISSNGCIDDEIQRRMAKALSADYTRDSGRTTMRVKGKIYRAIVLSTLLYAAKAWTLYRRQVKKLHAFMMRHLRSIIYGRSSDQKESPVDWTPHEDVSRQATKAESLLSTVFRSQKQRAPSSPVQGYHQEKLEAERHKRSTHGHHCHTTEING